MYHTHTFKRLLITGALLAFLYVPLQRASAQDWSGVFDTIFSEIPTSSFDFDVFDDVPRFAPRGNFYDNDDYNWNGNRGRYSSGRSRYVRTPSNVVQVALVEPVKNQKFQVAITEITTHELFELQQRARAEIRSAAEALAAFIPDDESLAAEIQNSSIDRSSRAQVFAATRAGDAVGVLKLFLDSPTTAARVEQESLVQQAEARRSLMTVLKSASAGSLVDSQLQDLKAAMMPFLASADSSSARAELVSADEHVNRLLDNSTIVNMLDAAEPGLTTMPNVASTRMIVSPDFPAGTVVPLSLDCAIVGAVNPTLGMFVGTGNLLEAAGAPIGAGQPVKDTSRKEFTGGVNIRNSTDAPVSYVLNGRHEYTMQSGYFQRLPGHSTWTIVFDRGGSHGEAHYTLDGSYRFELADKGWDLLGETFDTTIDNTSNTSDFDYVLNNEKHVVQAGQSNEHAGLTHPPMVRFDNGNGEVKKKALATGSYCVLLSESGGGLELYASESLQGVETAGDQDSIRREPVQLFAERPVSKDGEELFGSSVDRRGEWVVAEESTTSIFD